MRAIPVHNKGAGSAPESSPPQPPTTGKVFVRASLADNKALLSGLAIEGVVLDAFVASLRARCKPLSPADHALLERLFLVGNHEHYAAILPADDHPGKRLRSWRCFYELEGDAAQTYVSRFFPDVIFEPIKGFPLLQPGDDMVLIGSQVANYWTRTLMGRADGAAPLFEIAHAGWQTALHWNLHTPESAPLTTVREFRGPRASAAHVFCDRDSAGCYESERDLAGMGYLDDYLLVTALPHVVRGTSPGAQEGVPSREAGAPSRTVVFSGLHGPGSRAVDLVLRDPPLELLREADRQIGAARYYQMLLHVETRADEHGEGFPCNPTLVEARALVVE